MKYIILFLLFAIPAYAQPAYLIPILNHELKGKPVEFKALVYAIIETESNFDANAISHSGAVGLMQLMPSTASKYMKPDDDLFDPETNISIGVKFLNSLIIQYGSKEEAIIHYHNGTRTVKLPSLKYLFTIGMRYEKWLKKLK